MFDISWSEFLLIGIVALIVIGPKELPTVMRTLGQWTRKVRSMASEFQSQFHEAMREAEMADLKQQVDDMARDVKESVTQLDPLKEVREDVAGVGEDVKRSLGAPETDAAVPAGEAAPAAQAPAETLPAPAEAAAMPAAETSAPAPPQARSERPAPALEPVGAAAAEAQAAEPLAEAGPAEATGRNE
jgi:sec-independent protein translocase protein TatB